MEPRLPTSDLRPEQSQAFSSPSLEQRQIVSNLNPESVDSKTLENPRELTEIARNEVNTVPVLPAPVVSLPQPPNPIATDDVAFNGVTPSDTPLVAKDDDLIEKEWVDKAKKIITDTKEDPYKREQEVALLQADYLRKRYGKELGAPQ